MRELLGGLPDEVPEMYDLASPSHHVSAASPATLHAQGRHDQIAPIASARRLRQALEQAGVPAVFIEYPGTGHAFDLLVPPLLCPAGQAALHDVERFLACAFLPPSGNSAEKSRPPARQWHASPGRMAHASNLSRRLSVRAPCVRAAGCFAGCGRCGTILATGGSPLSRGRAWW